MRVLFDTHVILDALLDRRPFSAVAARLMGRVERREVEGFLGATTVTTIHYLLTKGHGSRLAVETVRRLLAIFEVAPVEGRTLALAAERPFADFEDAVLHEAAVLSGVEVIVTRDPKGFRRSELPVYEPESLEEVLLRLS